MDLDAEPWNCNHLGFARTKNYPHLKGKAAAVRVSVLWLHSFLTSNRCVGPQAWYLTLQQCTHNLAAFIHGVSTFPILLSAEQTVQLKRWGSQYLGLYGDLAAKALGDGQTLFKLRPKCHYFQHLLMGLGPLNPKVVSCWNDETFIGNITTIAARVHRRTTPLRLIQRYLYKLARELRPKGLFTRGSPGV